MLPQITSALSAGFTPHQIIKFLLKKFPQHASKIQAAQAAGFTIDQILNYISGGNRQQNEMDTSRGTEYEKMRNVQEQRREGINKSLLTSGALAAGAIAAPQAINAASSVLSRALPTSLQQLAPQIAATIMPSGQNQAAPPQSQIQTSPQQTGNLASPSQQPPITTVSPSIAQPPQAPQPERITINPKDFLEKAGVLKEVENGLKAKNSPEAIAASLGLKKGPGRLKAEIDPELQKNIEEYAKEFKPEEQKVPDLGEMGKSVSENLYKGLFEALQKGSKTFAGIKDPALEKARPAFERGEIKSPEDLKKFLNQPKIEPKSIVASPQGVGEIQAIRGDEAIIDIDGKKHKVKESEILKPPKEAAIEAIELIKSFTPEQMRSTHHLLNSYDEEEKKGFFVFHNGSAYVVDDISPEEYKELSEEIEEAKTSGETIIGKWAKGEGSRGAAYNKIVKGVRERKVVPELKKKYRKLKVGYNLLAEWQRLLNEKD